MCAVKVGDSQWVSIPPGVPVLSQSVDWRLAALFVAWYNLPWCHQTINTTPAVAAGLASEVWTLERLLTESAKAKAA